MLLGSVAYEDQDQELWSALGLFFNCSSALSGDQSSTTFSLGLNNVCQHFLSTPKHY